VLENPLNDATTFFKRFWSYRIKRALWRFAIKNKRGGAEGLSATDATTKKMHREDAKTRRKAVSGCLSEIMGAHQSRRRNQIVQKSDLVAASASSRFAAWPALQRAGLPAWLEHLGVFASWRFSFQLITVAFEGVSSQKNQKLKASSTEDRGEKPKKAFI